MSGKEKNRSGKESSDGRRGSISRREFTIGSITAFGAGSAAGAMPGTAAPSETVDDNAPREVVALVVTQAARTIKFTVNEWKYELLVEPEWVLRDVLRDQLGLLSIKDMCNGHGACGSCTVILDGRPVLSCMTLAIECDGVTIETAEHVAAVNPKLIEAYVLNHAMQCGYCTPGFVVTAKALIDRIPEPAEKDIRSALGGNICRCGTYPQHILAVQEATTGESE